jgi:pimeloyl-ACP methyl ester carboxylesterase
MNRIFHAADDLELTMTEDGTGRTALVLHGGGGPFTVAAISAHLAQNMQVLTPTHPGWSGTQRPDRVNRVADIADAYLQFLAAQGLRDVLIVGSSMGGWIAAEMASRDSAGLVGAIVMINAVGIEVPGQPIPNFFGLTPRQIAEHSFFEPDRFFVDPSTLPPERVALQRANIDVMRVYAGNPYMHDPSLQDRLAAVTVPVLLVWGEADKIATAAYGRAFADAFPNAEFAVVPRAGHLPQIEQPEATFALIDRFRSLV